MQRLSRCCQAASGSEAPVLHTQGPEFSRSSIHGVSQTHFWAVVLVARKAAPTPCPLPMWSY